MVSGGYLDVNIQELAEGTTRKVHAEGSAGPDRPVVFALAQSQIELASANWAQRDASRAFYEALNARRLFLPRYL